MKYILIKSQFGIKTGLEKKSFAIKKSFNQISIGIFVFVPRVRNPPNGRESLHSGITSNAAAATAPFSNLQGSSFTKSGVSIFGTKIVELLVFEK